MSGTVSEVVRTMLVADGLAWQNLFHRSRLLAGWTRRKRREIEAEHEQYAIIDEALPFALNQPTAPFRNGPGVNSEWLTFQLKLLVENGGRYDAKAALAAWQDLAGLREELRLSVGQHAALGNLAAGATPPMSGHDNPHYFDDSACFRAVALVCADDVVTGGTGGDVRGDVGGGARPEDLQCIVKHDAEISNAEDGVWCAQALAAALRGALDGAEAEAVVELARERLPEGSWSAIATGRALTQVAQAVDVFDLIARLNDEAGNHLYDYGNSAPETLGASLAIVMFTRGELSTSLLAALGLPRTAASVAPMIGALCGALGTAEASSFEPVPLRGLALPHLAGLQPLSLLDRLQTHSI